MSIKKQAGITLVELILYIVIVSIGLAGILSVMNVTTQRSADPMVRKQALAVAESLLEEITLKEYDNPTDGFTGPATQANRSQFDDVSDYDGFALATVVDIAGSSVGLSGYSVDSVSVTVSALTDVPEAKLITVTVSGPGGETIALSGYRTNYAP